MSETETAATAGQRNGSLVVRGAEPADHEAIDGVVLGAHARYAAQLVPEVFSRYLDEVLDLGTHASYGRLLVAATQERILGFAAFYPDGSAHGSGFPAGWAAVRVLAAGYEQLGYRWAPEFDGTAPVGLVAHLRYVAQMYMNLAR